MLEKALTETAASRPDADVLALKVGPRYVVLTANGVELGRYAFEPDAPAVESPKPHWHPLRTLSGGPITGYRPWDHRWHTGLQMTWTHVSGQNFWGGPSYVDGEGYVWKDNVGRIRHDRFTDVRAGGDGSPPEFTEELTWITSGGETWMTERRTHRFTLPDPLGGVWVMNFTTVLRNVRGEHLHLGSPTTEGRPAAGYTGLFLRMPRAWTGGNVFAPGVAGADALMGREAPWVAFSGQHDEVDGGASVIAYAGTSSGGPPVKWFVRNEPYPVLAPSPSFDEEVVLADGAELRLAHRFAFLDRIRDDDELTRLAEGLAP
jgi:hypothetical protein